VNAPTSFAGKVARCYLPFAAGYFLSYAFRVVNGAIAPDMTRDLALDPAALGAVTSAYFAAFALRAIAFGRGAGSLGPAQRRGLPAAVRVDRCDRVRDRGGHRAIGDRGAR
jgi:MFS family permease